MKPHVLSRLNITSVVNRIMCLFAGNLEGADAYNVSTFSNIFTMMKTVTPKQQPMYPKKILYGRTLLSMPSTRAPLSMLERGGHLCFANMQQTARKNCA